MKNVSNKNVELGGKNGFKLFHNGIAHWIRKQISVDGGFHISMARQLNVFLCTMELLPMSMKQLFGRSYSLLFQVHANLRMPVRKSHIAEYQDTINSLLACMKSICRPSSKSECNSMKYHYPYHWGDTRIDLGCPANEKSLERKLSESQKRHYAFTNKKDNCDGQMVLILASVIQTILCNEHVTSYLQEHRDERIWQLSDVLAAAGEAPMTAHIAGEDNTFGLVTRQAAIQPHLTGLYQMLNMDNHTGLPNWLSIDERRGMRLAIATALKNKSVSWMEPVKTFTQMKLTFENRQQVPDSCERLVQVR